jgi:hypothetical protein
VPYSWFQQQEIIFFAGFKKKSCPHREYSSGANADGIITIETEQLRYISSLKRVHSDDYSH